MTGEEVKLSMTGEKMKFTMTGEEDDSCQDELKHTHTYTHKDTNKNQQQQQQQQKIRSWTVYDKINDSGKARKRQREFDFSHLYLIQQQKDCAVKTTTRRTQTGIDRTRIRTVNLEEKQH